MQTNTNKNKFSQEETLWQQSQILIPEKEEHTVTVIEAHTCPWYNSLPILSLGIWKVEELTLGIGPISGSARNSKERTEKQNNGSLTSQRKIPGGTLMYCAGGRLEASKELP